MADIQLEHGFTKIANELLDVVIKTPFIATHLKIVLVCWRYMYGFNRQSAELSESFISKATGISKRYISRELRVLIDSKVIKVVKESTYSSPRVLSFNKDYDTWEYRTRVPQVNQSSTGEPEYSTTVEPQFNTTVEPQFHQETKTLNKTLNKCSVDVFFEKIWALYPKRRGKGKVSKAQKEKLFKIGYDEISRAIERYKKETAGKDPQYIMYGSTFFNSGYVDYLDKNYINEQEKQGTGGDIYAGYTNYTGKFRD
jgi:phage replication O-like protein O